MTLIQKNRGLNRRQKVKRILLVLVVYFMTCFIVYAQQGFPTRQEQQDYLGKVKQNTSEYDSRMDDIRSRNSSSGEALAFLRLKSDIDNLDTRITKEMNNIDAVHNRDQRVTSQVLSSLENMINQRKAKQDQLEDLLSN